MNYLDKIKKVRENIEEWQKEHGKEFSYAVLGIGFGEDPIDDWTYLVSPEEEGEIIKYLGRRGFIEIIEEKEKSFQIKVLPKQQSVIKLKTLELISRELKDHYTGYEITKLLEECGADKKMIIYPNSKWHIFYGLFEELAMAQDKKAKELLFRIISEAIHPLNLSGNNELSDTLVQKFNEYLKYDNLVILYSDKEQKYTVNNLQNLVEVDEEELAQNFAPLIEEILPDINKCTISERVIELVAQVFNNNLSGSEIRKVITPFLNKNKLISKEPFIKGYIDDLFEEKNWLFNLEKVLDFIKRKDEDADKTIAGIIEKLLYPLNYNADEEKAENIAQTVGKYLEYDKFYIQNVGKEYLVLSDQEMSEMHSFPEFEEKERKGKKDDEEKIKQNKEIIKTLRDTHQSFIDILEIFCRDTKKPTKELNNAYIFLSNKIKKDIEKVGLKTLYYGIYFYKPFENDLYSAEAEWNKQAKRLSWDGIRPALYKTHSNITKLLNMSEEDAVMTDEEKKLEDITKLISEKRTEKKVSIKDKTEKTLKIEISKMPDLNVRNVEDNTTEKSKKRVTLPKFPRTEWVKVSVTFLDETNILLSDGKSTKPSSFEGMGCEDGRNGKANENWAFLLKLAKGNGQTPPITKKERESEKKQKQKITDILRNIYQNQTDPFETEAGGVYKARFNIKYNSDKKEKVDSKYADSEDIFSEMTEPVREDKDGDFSQ